MKVPPGWASVTVGEVADSVKSGFASGDHNRHGDGVPHLRPMNIGRDGELTLTDLRYVEDSDGARLQRGDILFNNTNSSELVGKTTWIDVDREFAFSNHMTRVRVTKGVSSQFVARQLHHMWARGTFRLLCNNHVSQASISTRTLAEEVEILLPPLDEQRRIVDKIEELTVRSKRAKQALDNVPLLLDQLRQSVLAAAFRGDLTADWRAENPDVEPAAALLARMDAERRGPSKLQRRSTDVVGDPPPIPKGWAWMTLERLASTQRPICYGVVQPGEDDSQGVQLVRVCDLVGDGRAIDKSSLRRITPTVDAEYARSRLEGGELLVSVVGTIGRTAIAPVSLRGANIARAIARVAFLRPWMSEWAAFWLNTSYMVDRLNRDSREVARKTLNLAQLAVTPIPVPSEDEAAPLLDRLRTMMAHVDSQSTVLGQMRSRIEALDAAILAKAFRGELVPQKPKDKPPPTQITLTVDPDLLHDAIFEALWTIGPLKLDVAVRKIAEHLGELGHADFQRLRIGGPLHAQILAAIETAVTAGHLDQPRPGYVRARKPDATTYTADDWRHALVASLGPNPIDRDAAILQAAEWARENFGLDFTRLRADGHIAQGLRSAINSAIRRQQIIRHDAKRISR